MYFCHVDPQGLRSAAFFHFLLLLSVHELCADGQAARDCIEYFSVGDLALFVEGEELAVDQKGYEVIVHTLEGVPMDLESADALFLVGCRNLYALRREARIRSFTQSLYVLYLYYVLCAICKDDVDVASILVQVDPLYNSLKRRGYLVQVAGEDAKQTAEEQASHYLGPHE